jgi:hypothetical protein
MPAWSVDRPRRSIEAGFFASRLERTNKTRPKPVAAQPNGKESSRLFQKEGLSSFLKKNQKTFANLGCALRLTPVSDGRVYLINNVTQERGS